VNSVIIETDVKNVVDIDSDVIRNTLSRLRAIDGLLAVCVVDPDSAQVLEAVIADGDRGDGDAAVTVVAAAAGDVVQVINLMLSTLGEPDELEDVIITLGRRHHLIVPRPQIGADGVLVVLTLDRERTNLARARLQVRACGPLLAPPPETGHVA